MTDDAQDHQCGGYSLTESRSMPAMGRIVDYWRDENPQWLKSAWVGWGEPFCFACGWLPPVADGRKDSWRSAGKWLDRAHLQDYFYGGPDEPFNLVPVCHLCHRKAPDLPTREDGLGWIQGCERVHPCFQMYTDGALRRKTPTRTTTLLEARSVFLESIMSDVG